MTISSLHTIHEFRKLYLHIWILRKKKGVTYKGTKKYIIAIVFDNIEVHNVKEVPHDIDGLSVYTVPMLNTLENCRGYRNWEPAVSSKTVTFKDGPPTTYGL